jgi:hypothetical protein
MLARGHHVAVLQLPLASRHLGLGLGDHAGRRIGPDLDLAANRASWVDGLNG